MHARDAVQLTVALYELHACTACVAAFGSRRWRQLEHGDTVCIAAEACKDDRPLG